MQHRMGAPFLPVPLSPVAQEAQVTKGVKGSGEQGMQGSMCWVAKGIAVASLQGMQRMQWSSEIVPQGSNGSGDSILHRFHAAVPPRRH